jgi:hypothetical protein
MTSLEIAVIELVRAQDEVRRLGKEIGDALCKSEEAQVASRQLGKQPTNWLKLAYERESEYCHNTYTRHYWYVNHDDDIEGYLAEHCEHALRAHILILERKEARRQVGMARRRVSLIGRNLTKALEKQQ